MSGGSLNYLFCKEPSELCYHLEELEEAERELLKQGYKDIAQDVRRLIEYIQTAENRIGVLAHQLRDVFKAVEWWQCGDYGDETFKRVLEKYRKGETEK